jgi:phosphatidylserine/phosphatidylglycerophosphate/cardiolipin synthase-like enzyme
MSTTPTLPSRRPAVRAVRLARQPTPPSAANVFGSVLEQSLGAVLIAQAVAAFLAGERDPNRLTDLLFFARHKDLVGRHLTAADHKLIQEWLGIRDRIVAPALRQAATLGRPGAGPASTPVAVTATASAAASRFMLPPDPSQLLPPARTGIGAWPLYPGDKILDAEIQLIRETASRPDGWVYMANWFADLRCERRQASQCEGALQPFLAELRSCAQKGGRIRALFWAGELRGEQANIAAALAPLTGFADYAWTAVTGVTGSALKRGTSLSPSGLIKDALEWIIEKLTNHAENVATAGILNRIPAESHLPADRVVARLDDCTLSVGSHHQKIFVVGNSERTIAVIGGFDLNPNRIEPRAGEPGTPYFDVSVQLDGAAAVDVAEIFERRWNADPERQRIPSVGRRPPTQPPDPWGPGATVQVGVNYGCRYPMRDIPHAVRGADALIANLLRNCRSFFYAEDQYGTGNDELRMGINQAFANGARFGIVILATAAGVDDTPEIDYWRHQFWSKFPQINRNLLVFERLGDDGRPDGQHAYVHSKLIVVDDEAATIGSVNMNRRSWYYDSELAAVVSDTSGLIRGLRTGIWKHHLWGPTQVPWPGEQIDDPARGFAVFQAAHVGSRRPGFLKPLTFASPPTRHLPATYPKADDVYRVLAHVPGIHVEQAMTSFRVTTIDPTGPTSC